MQEQPVQVSSMTVILNGVWLGNFFCSHIPTHGSGEGWNASDIQWDRRELQKDIHLHQGGFVILSLITQIRLSWA